MTIHSEGINPTDNEKLIEEARRWPRGSGVIPSAAPGELIPRLADALEAAEKAHTPTDDEREAMAERIVTHHLSRLSKRDGWAEDDTAVGGQAANIVRQLAEAGLLRRSEVPEPSAGRARALHDAFWAVHAGRFHGRDTEHGVDTFYAGTNAAKRAIENLHGSPIIRPWSVRVVEPQGEPSDAPVRVVALAIRNGMYLDEARVEMLADDEGEFFDQVARAALRAAGEVTR